MFIIHVARSFRKAFIQGRSAFARHFGDERYKISESRAKNK